MQMDIKVKGITREIFEEALAQAKSRPCRDPGQHDEQPSANRARMSAHMRRRPTSCIIKTDKIKDVIGPGGKMINQIIEACDKVKIDIDDDGQVVIYHTDREAINKAAAMIEDIVREAKVGDIYDATVVRIEKFGAFVTLFPGTDGLLHISKISHNRVDQCGGCAQDR